MNNNKLSGIVVVIPSLNPDNKLINTIKKLKSVGFENFILVNDGSTKETAHYFNEAKEIMGDGGKVLVHSINLGQGRAYKTAFNYYLQAYPDSVGVVECDGDGQHSENDVLKCAELLIENPEKFILGVRNFNNGNVPFRSRFGNICTSLVFKFLCGMNISDTQTGLKAIPKSLIPYMMECAGERYEYCSSVLLEVKKWEYSIVEFPIETIYIDENASSHFNPLLDSIRIYSFLLKYAFSSLSASIVDLIAFTVFLAVFKSISSIPYIIISTYAARIVSCTYTFVVNKKLVFQSKSSATRSVIKFAILCIVQATCSAFLVNAFYEHFDVNEVLIKVIVDTILFFFSFEIQQNWVFKSKS